jgi:hypothetical protein
MLISNKTLDVSDFSLLAVNLSVIAYAYINHLDMAWFFWVYWAQSVVIGVFNVFKILSVENYDVSGVRINGREMSGTEGEKRYMAGFFAMHYGFFHFVYFVFIVSIVGIGALIKWDVLVAILLYFVNHLISYLINNPFERKQRQNIGTMFFKPYLRIIPMHLIIVAGGLFFKTEGAVVLMLVKTAGDFVMHFLEHHVPKSPAAKSVPIEISIG